MRQKLGKEVIALSAATAVNGLPVGDVGIALALYDGTMKCSKWLVTVKSVGTGSFDLALHGRAASNPADARWGAAGDLDGRVTSAPLIGVASPGRAWHFVVANLGVFKDLYAQVLNITGTVSVSVWVAEILENNMSRGD